MERSSGRVCQHTHHCACKLVCPLADYSLSLSLADMTDRSSAPRPSRLAALAAALPVSPAGASPAHKQAMSGRMARPNATSSSAAAAAALHAAADTDPVPPRPSLLHSEPPMPTTGSSSSLHASSRALFGETGLASLAAGVVAVGIYADDSSMPERFTAHVKANAITPPDAVPPPPPKRPGATGTGAAAAATTPAVQRTPAQQLQATAESLWRQEQKWGSMFRAASRLQQAEEAALLLQGRGAKSSAPVNEKDVRRTAFACYAQSHPLQVRRLISRGIPAQYRGFVWQQLSGSGEPAWRASMMAQHFRINIERDDLAATATAASPASTSSASSDSSSTGDKPSTAPLRSPLSDLSPFGAYQRILSESGTSPLEEQILKDLNRTFPKQVFFRDRAGMGQSSLFHVLKAYALFDRALGYCQGMGYIAGQFSGACCTTLGTGAAGGVRAVLRQRRDLPDAHTPSICPVCAVPRSCSRAVAVHVRRGRLLAAGVPAAPPSLRRLAWVVRGRYAETQRALLPAGGAVVARPSPPQQAPRFVVHAP